MHVLDLNTLFIDGGEGGVNTYLKEKARCLGDGLVRDVESPGRPIRHTIVVPGRETCKSTLGAATLYTIRSPPVPGNRQHRLLVDFGRIRQILRAEAPDVVEVDTSYFLGRLARRALRGRAVPVVGFHHVHLPLLYTRPLKSRLRRSLRRSTSCFSWLYSRFCARGCDRIAVPSRGLRDELDARGFPETDLVPLGVNLELFRPRAGGARPAIEGIDPGRPLLLFVGRLSAEKEIDTLFAAHAEVARTHRAQLLIVGEGPLRRRTLELAARRKDVLCPGLRPYGEGLAELYRAADALVVPGASETFGLTVLEAFASGLPVVAAEAGGLRDLCQPGVGDLARPGDALDFARKLRDALAQRGRVSRLRAHVEAVYSWERTFGRMLEVCARARRVTSPCGRAAMWRGTVLEGVKRESATS